MTRWTNPNFEYINLFADSYNPFGANELRGRYYSMVVQAPPWTVQQIVTPKNWNGQYNEAAFQGGDSSNSNGMSGSGIYTTRTTKIGVSPGRGNQPSCADDIDTLLKLDPEDGSNNYTAGGWLPSQLWHQRSARCEFDRFSQRFLHTSSVQH